MREGEWNCSELFQDIAMSACNVPAFCRILIESTREDETCDSISHSLVNSGRTFFTSSRTSEQGI